MPTQWKSAARTTTTSASSCSRPKSRTSPGSTPCFVSWRRSLSAMLVTIWTCTQEWSLIAIRETALTLETCHQPLSWSSSLTRSTSVRSLRLPRTGTLIFIRATASVGVRRVSCSASASTGCSIRSAVSLSIAIGEVCRMAYRWARARSPSSPSGRRGRLRAQSAHRLLPSAARDPALHLVLPLDRVDRDHQHRQLADLDLHRPAVPLVPPTDVRLRPLPGAPLCLRRTCERPLSGLHG